MHIDHTKIDWALLRKQKATAYTLATEFYKNTETGDHLMGLVHLLDNLQDAAAEELGDKAVFGP